MSERNIKLSILDTDYLLEMIGDAGDDYEENEPEYRILMALIAAIEEQPISAHTLFTSLSDVQKQQMYTVTSAWRSDQVKEEDIELTPFEENIMFMQNKMVQGIKLLRARTKCSLKVAKGVYDREKGAWQE